MALEQFGNSPTPSSPSTAWTLLSGAISAGATSLTLLSAAPFPTVAQFRLLIDDELILVTALAGAVATVTRGIEGTTAASHADGASVYHVLTAAGLGRHPRAMTTAGDTEYLGATGAPTRLAAPANGDYVTRWTSGVPSWVAAPSLTGYALTSYVDSQDLAVLATVAAFGYVPGTRTVNGHALSANVSVTASDVGLGSVENAAASGLYVPLARTVNGQALSSNVTISYATLGAMAWANLTGTPTTLSGYGITDAVNSATTRAAHLVFAGPASGSASAPTFRALVAADIPALPYGTGDVTAAGNNTFTGTNIFATGPEAGDVLNNATPSLSFLNNDLTLGAAYPATPGIDGGSVVLFSGGPTSGAGGARAQLYGAEAVSGNGGYVVFTGGNAAVGSNGNGGYLSFSAGLKDGSGEDGEILFGGDVLFGPIAGTTVAFGPDETSTTALVFRAFDVDGTAYKTFATLTNANTPSFALAAPAGGSLTGDFSTLAIGGAAVATQTYVGAQGFVTASSSTAFTNKTGAISQWTNDASYTTLAAVAGVGYLTSVTAHNLLSATHGDTTAGTVARGDLITGQGASAKWVRLPKGTANQVLAMDGTATDIAWTTLAAGGDALTTNPLSQFAATTSLQLKGVISDETGSGALVFATSPTLVTPVLGVAAATSVSSTASNVNTQSIAAVSTDGYVLINTTAAAAGAQQWSPRLRLTGQGWKTTATAASQTVDWIIENVPTQLTTTPGTQLVFSSQVNAGGYTPVMLFDRDAGNNQFIYLGATSTSSYVMKIGSSVGARVNNAFSLSDNNNAVYNLDPGFGIGLAANTYLAFSQSNNAPYDTKDVIVRRGGAAATLQMGSDVNGAAVSQQLQAANGITGTDKTGGNFTLASGKGTGAGAVSSLIFQTPTVLTTGTTAQSLATRLTLTSAVATFAVPIKLSNAAVTGLVAGVLAASTNASIVLQDSSGQAYRIPCII